MFDAAIRGDCDGIMALLGKDPGLVRCESSYRTPLHFAVRENQIDAALLLLNCGADATYVSNPEYHHRPLQMAQDRGYDELARLLEEQMFQQWGICPAGDEIAAAFRDRDRDRTVQLIEEHGIEVADVRGNKPIHWAVMTRQVNWINALLEYGADIDSERPDGARPLDLTNGDYWYRGWRDLHPDAPKDHMAIMSHLLAKGAFYDLTTACRRGDMETVAGLITKDPVAAKRDADYSTWYSGYPLRSAAKAGELAIVELLLMAGADPNHPEHGLAPFGGSLYDAVQNGHLDVVKMLLQFGANANQEVESSGSAYSAAESDEMKSLLRENGGLHCLFSCCYNGYAEDFAAHCERDPFTANDSRLFGMAAEHGLKEIVSIFLKHQPDMWSRCPAYLGKTPEIQDWMVANGWQVNNTGWMGIHAIHHGDDPEKLQQWLDLGVDVNLIDGEHQSTPLGWAARRGNVELVKLFLANGADPQLAGADWAKPIEWAKRRGHRDIVALF